VSITRVDVLLWAHRILAMKKDAPAYQLLEIKQDTTLDDAQAAFHKIARVSHPDLHRTTLDENEYEQVTRAYARVAGAYQDFRSTSVAVRLKSAGSGPAEPAAAAAAGAAPARPTPVPEVPAARPGAANTAMSSKALIYYRKAELALRRGDLKGAVLQIKMAIAADPTSAFLRTALLEVETEAKKT
jgi:hypothetical protein